MEQKGHVNWYWMLLAPFLSAFATALVYLPSLHYEFQFDDVANITKHFNIRHYSLKRLFFSGPRWISYWLNSLIYGLGKFEPFFYRLFNVIFHIANGILVFFIFFLLLSGLKRKSFFKEHAYSISLLTMILFLLHPVQTQTVSYVIQGQLEGLCCLAINAMILFFALFHQSNSSVMKPIFGTFFFIATFLSCGTKEIAIICPFMILLCDWFFIAQGNIQSLKKRAIFYGALFTFILSIYLYFLKPSFFTDILRLNRTAQNNIGNIITAAPKELITPWLFFISQFKVILHYLWIFLWPLHISVEYDWKLAESFSSADSFFPFLILCSIVWGIYRLLRHNIIHPLAFGLCWFFIAIAPRSTIIPSPELLVDYKTYTASIGWLFVIAAALTFSFLYLQQKIRTLQRSALTPIAASILFSALLGTATIQRNHVWRSGLEFWDNVIAHAPNKARAYNNYGVELSQKLHRFSESIPYFQKAIAMDKQYPDPCNNLAVAYSQLGKIDLAIKSLRDGIRINPYYPEGYNNLASFYVQEKKFDEAEKILKIALRLRPHYGKAHFNLGRVYLEKNDVPKAWECFRACCMSGDLDNEFGFTMYAKASMALKKYDDALVAYTHLIEHKPNDYETLLAIANLYCLTKKPDAALTIYEKLRAIQPKDIRVVYNLAEAYLQLNRIDEAITLFAQLKHHEQQFPHINIRLAACYEKIGNIAMAQQLLLQLVQGSAPQELKKNAQTLLAELKRRYQSA